MIREATFRGSLYLPIGVLALFAMLDMATVLMAVCALKLGPLVGAAVTFWLLRALVSVVAVHGLQRRTRWGVILAALVLGLTLALHSGDEHILMVVGRSPYRVRFAWVALLGLAVARFGLPGWSDLGTGREAGAPPGRFEG